MKIIEQKLTNFNDPNRLALFKILEDSVKTSTDPIALSELCGHIRTLLVVAHIVFIKGTGFNYKEAELAVCSIAELEANTIHSELHVVNDLIFDNCDIEKHPEPTQKELLRLKAFFEQLPTGALKAINEAKLH